MEPSVLAQVTAVFVEPVTVAANCWVPPEVSIPVVGEIAIVTAVGPLMVRVAEADLVVSAWLVALTVTVVLETVGAV